MVVVYGAAQDDFKADDFTWSLVTIYGACLELPAFAWAITAWAAVAWDFLAWLCRVYFCGNSR
jgi:hypothetical protein